MALADDVGLDVVETQALGADGLDQVREAIVVEIALAAGGGVEVDAVDYALQARVSFATARMWLVTPSPILSASLRITDQTGCSRSSGSSGR